MPEAWCHPQSLKNQLLNAVDVGKEPGANPMFPLVALTVDEDLGSQAYGRSAHTAGWTYTVQPIAANDWNTVLLPWDEAKDLAQAVGKTSAAKDAQVWVGIQDGRLAVAYGSEAIADLPGVEPGDGDIEGVNEDLQILNSTGPQARDYLAVSTEIVKRFSKVRAKSPIMDFYLTNLGCTVLVKIGEHFTGAFEAVNRDRVEKAEEYLF